jgi:hypothetical protein
MALAGGILAAKVANEQTALQLRTTCSLMMYLFFLLRLT